MKTPLRTTFAALCFARFAIGSAHAGFIVTTTDNFGSGANAFSIQFAHVGNAGNANDRGVDIINDTPGNLNDDEYASPNGGVSYDYRMGVTEVPQDWVTKATNLGGADLGGGAWTGNQPAADMTWYQAAAFVNYLNTSTGHQAAYQLNGTATGLTLWTSAQAWQAGGENLYRHKDAYYFLPSENEWYKAAYHKNDGVTANYWDYATGSNTIPTAVSGGTGAGTAVYNGQSAPADITLAGGLSPYGTMGQNGNVWEWAETAYDGINNSSAEDRLIRGGIWTNSDYDLRSSIHNVMPPTFPNNSIGFRVASIEPIPEPGTALFGVLLLGVATARRRRR